MSGSTVGIKGFGRLRAMELPDGQNAPVSPPGRGAIRYNNASKQFEGSVDAATYEAFGGAGGGGTTVADFAALSTLDDSTFVDGVNVAVTSVRDMFELDTTSTLTVDGVTVLATASGTGRWVRRELPSLVWASQATFFIDPAAGDDQNDGSTSGTAIETWAEYARRVGEIVVPVYQVVTFVGDANEGAYQLRGRHPMGLTVQGETTQDQTGTFGAVTAIDTTTSPITEGRVTDAGANPFTAHVGKVIRVTSGGASGSYAWILQDDPGGAGADVARVTEFFNPFTFATPVPSPGDAYEILGFVTVTGTWSIDTTDPLSDGFTEFFLIELTAALQPIRCFGTNSFLTTAKVSQTATSAASLVVQRFDMLGSLVHRARLVIENGTSFWFSSGILDGQLTLAAGASLGAQGNNVAQVVSGGAFQSRDVYVVDTGCRIETSPAVFARGVGFGVYDLAAGFSGFSVAPFAVLDARGGSARFWTVGQAAGSFGVRINAAGLAAWPPGTSAPASYNLDPGGAGTEFEVGGVATDAASLAGAGTVTAANNAAAVPRSFN